MSLVTDIIFVKALRSNTDLMALLPSGDVHNTSIPLPDANILNAPVPYIIVTFDGLQNDDTTKDDIYEGTTDKVMVSIEVAAAKRPQLGELVTAIRRTIREYFINVPDTDEDYPLVPTDYTFTADAVQYDSLKPCYWQVLHYQCDTNANNYEQDE